MVQGSIYKDINGLQTDRRPFINTLTGIYEIGAPDAKLAIYDIAAGVAQKGRWSGQSQPTGRPFSPEYTPMFFSVAEHSVLMAAWVHAATGDPVLALAALLHDGPEFCLGDLGSPIKYGMADHGIDMGVYLEAEKVVFEDMQRNFDFFLYPLPRIVIEADARILVDEFRMRFPDVDPAESNVKGEPLGIAPQFWLPDKAYHEFVAAYDGYVKTAREEFGSLDSWRKEIRQRMHNEKQWLHHFNVVEPVFAFKDELDAYLESLKQKREATAT